MPTIMMMMRIKGFSDTTQQMTGFKTFFYRKTLYRGNVVSVIMIKLQSCEDIEDDIVSSKEVIAF